MWDDRCGELGGRPRSLVCRVHRFADKVISGDIPRETDPSGEVSCSIAEPVVHPTPSLQLLVDNATPDA
jgi:hypothetical protein